MYSCLHDALNHLTSLYNSMKLNSVSLFQASVEENGTRANLPHQFDPCLAIRNPEQLHVHI